MTLPRFLLMLCLPSAVFADINLEYDVKFKGLTVATVELDVVESEEKYGIGIGANTQSLAALIGKQSSYFSTVGERESTAVISHHRVIEFHGKGVRESDVYWKNGLVDRYHVNPNDPVHKTGLLSPEQLGEVLDPLTPLYKIISGQNRCASEDNVFDGRRHYRMQISELRSDDSGFACAIRVTPISGFENIGDFDLAGENGAVIEFVKTDVGAIPQTITIESAKGRAVFERKP